MFMKINIFSSSCNLFKKNKLEIFIFLSTFFFVIFLRFWNLEKWWLIDGNELDMITYLKKSLISIVETKANPTSTFFPTLLIAKIFFFINSFPEYRYITAFLCILSTLFIYFAARTFLVNNKKYLAFIPTFLIAINSLILFATRRFTVDGVDVLFIGLILYLTFKWRMVKKNIYIYLIFVFSALGINNHGTMLYFTFPLFLWFGYLLIKNKIKLKTIFFSSILFLIILLPYINGLRITNYNVYLLEKYYGAETATTVLINLFYFNNFVENLYQVIIPSNLWGIISSPYIPDIMILPFLRLSFLFIILTLPLLVYFYCKFSDSDLKFLILYSYGVIILIFFSPILSTIGHFIPFFIVFSFLLTKELSLKQKSTKLILIPLILIIYFNFLLSIQILTKNSYKELEQIWPENVKTITIEFIPLRMLNLTYPSILDDIKKINIFECRSDGIYVYNDSHTIYDPDFLKRKNFIQSDMVLLQTVSACKFYNIFSIDNLPLKYIGRVDEIAFYNKI